MRAAEIRTPGEPPVVAERAAPVPGEGEVLVEVVAAPIIPLDLFCASGKSYFGVPATPYVPGVQGVGRVGGQSVWFPTSAGMAPGDGGMAEHAVVPEPDLVAAARRRRSGAGRSAGTVGRRRVHGVDLARRARRR